MALLLCGLSCLFLFVCVFVLENNGDREIERERRRRRGLSTTPLAVSDLKQITILI